MIDIRLIRNEPDVVRAALARRGNPELLDQVEQVIALDVRSREIVAQRDAMRAEVNELSKQVGALRRTGDTVAADAVQARSRTLGDDERVLAGEYDALQAQIRELLLRIPNLPDPAAPDGTSEADNPVVTGPHGLLDEYPPHQRVPHWETANALGILDNERAGKISGAMFTMQRGLGATLSRALCQFALDRNADAFEEIRPPSLVSTATLTSVYAGEVLDEAQLPIRMMAYTPCYRREAGSAGRDTRGMLRAHEFDKVEILAVATPEQSSALLQELVGRAEALMVALELPYRIIDICTGDMGQSHHRSFDIEVYAPGADAWLEVSSISWFSDYQARRADIRYRVPGEKGTRIANTLNGSALAVPRVWAAIVENYRQPDGSVVVPTALRPYMRGAEVIPVPMSAVGR